MDIKDLKVVFMGTPEFSLNVLDMLIKNTNVCLVVTQPDKIVGRGNNISYTPVKKLAMENNIPVFQPEKIRKDYERVLECKPDLIVTCAYGQIIPEILLNLPKYGAINVHASLLPKLRGGSPLHHSIIDGYDKTGVSIMYMDKTMDTGDILSQVSIPILDEDNVGTIHDKLSVLGSSLLLETINKMINNKINPIKQDNENATYCHNITHDEELLDFNKNAREIFNHVRGMNPYPVAYFKLKNCIYKIYEVSYKVTDDYCNHINGEVLQFEKAFFRVKCNDGYIDILNLKKEGKKRMNVKDYLNGEKDNYLGEVINDEK